MDRAPLCRNIFERPRIIAVRGSGDFVAQLLEGSANHRSYSRMSIQDLKARLRDVPGIEALTILGERQILNLSGRV